MSSTTICPECGGTLNTLGSCPRCQLGEGLAETRVEQGPPDEIQELERRFPGYEFERRIGRGGMGVVYRARHRRLDRKVAVKILSPDLARAPSFTARFEREARTLARLSHPGLVAVHDYEVREDRCVLFLEYVDGVNLRELMGSNSLTPGQSLDIVQQVCEALQYAHGEGVVHRDIKPENILIDTHGRVKIADFGLARLMGGDRDAPRLTRTRQVMGTPHYMAPEQMHEPESVDHRADIFALGVVFYELLTGGLPVGRFGPPSQGGASDPRLDEVVLKTLEQKRENRYQEIREMKRDLEAIAKGQAGAPVERQPASSKAGGLALAEWFEPTVAAIGIAALLLPWFEVVRGNQNTDYLFPLEQYHGWLALGALLFPLCVWDTCRGLIKKAEKKGETTAATRIWPGLQILSNIVAAAGAIAATTVMVERHLNDPIHVETYLFVGTGAAGGLLGLAAAARLAHGLYGKVRSLCISTETARGLAFTCLLLAGLGGLTLLLPERSEPAVPGLEQVGHETRLGVMMGILDLGAAILIANLRKAGSFRYCGTTGLLAGLSGVGLSAGRIVQSPSVGVSPIFGVVVGGVLALTGLALLLLPVHKPAATGD